MINNPIISIIIPVYNCEPFIRDTLESIRSQSFRDWECILVDDNSIDNVIDILKEYEKKDVRFKLFEKPSEIKKGANASRNYGFLKASGSFIKWFDCDDIMLPNNLLISYDVLMANKLDFVVTDTINFDNITNNLLDKPYDFNKHNAKITIENYAFSKIGWITDDFFCSKVIVEKIKFNEEITALGDEYNFFIKLLHHSINGAFIDEILTHRRVHANSITNSNKVSSSNYLKIIGILKFQTAQDLVVYNNTELIRWFLSGYMKNAFEIAIIRQAIPYKKEAFKLICNYFSIQKGFVFMIALFLASCFKKGYNIMKYARS